MAKTTFLNGGRFAILECNNGSVAIIKNAGDDGVLSPPIVSVEGDENWEAFNQEIAASGEVDANVDFSALIDHLTNECLSIQNCPDGGPLSVQLDLSNLDPDGDGIINVEGDVNANVVLDPITTLLTTINESIADGSLQIGNDCSNPIPVSTCPENPLEVVNDTYLGDACFDELAESISSEPINGTSGTLSNGVTYTLVDDGPTATIFGTAPGDIRWEDSTLTLTASGPVSLLLTPVTAGDPVVLNPIVWSHQNNTIPPSTNGGNFTLLSSDGELVEYVPGAIDAVPTLNDSGLSRAWAGLADSAAPTATQDWGQFKAPRGTVFTIRGRDAEAMNISVLPFSPSGEPQTLSKIRKADGSIVHLDGLGNVVDTSAMIEVACTREQVSVVSNEVHGAADIPNNSVDFSIPVDEVWSYTVSSEGGDPVIVDTGNGIVTIHRAGSRTFGTGNRRIDTSAVTITTGANSNADLFWEA